MEAFMTTVFYKPESFVACDSKWTVNGFEINDIRENKFIFHNAKSDNQTLVTFMAGSHIAIVLHQASIVGLITPEQFFSLYSIYDQYFTLDYDFVSFSLSSGVMKSGPNFYYPEHKNDGIYSFGSGGLYAGVFFYHASIYSRKKRFKVPLRKFDHSCSITGSMSYAYKRDLCSGGLVNKIVWLEGSIAESTMLPLGPDYKHNVQLTLIETMREIHEMYTEKAQNQIVASIADKKKELKEKRSKADVYAKSQSNGQATKMTVSTALDHIKWLESL